MSKKKELWQKRVDELLLKEIIDKEAAEGLTQMISSPDNENFTLVEEVLKDSIRKKLSENLNTGQNDAFYKMVDFLENPQHDALVLKGYAGTGKTFLVKRVIEYIAQTDHKKTIAISAPTNKAVNVLFKDSPANAESMHAYVLDDIFDANSRLVYSTIHKLLGLKEIITENGDQLFQVDSRSESDLSNYNVLIVDEVSMLDDKLCTEIMKLCKKIRIIFMGDPAQIPPVKRTDSIPFSTKHSYSFNIVELTEIMRQKEGNPIIKVSFEIRNNLTKEHPVPIIKTELNEEGHGVIFMDNITERDYVKPLLEKYFKTEEFKLNSDFMKVIAWRNRTVAYINSVVRGILYGEKPDTYVVGEKLIANKPIFEKSIVTRGRNKYDKWSVKYSTSEEFEIANVSKIDKYMHEGSHTIQLTFYKLDIIVDNAMKGGVSKDTIYVIHEDSAQEYADLLERTKQLAKATFFPQNWAVHYNIQKWSANVTYNYAITGHKSQGSTYKNVLIIEEDLDMNKKVVERNRIKYTVFSRPTDRLYVLRTNLSSNS